MQDLVKLNVPCSPFLIMVSPHLAGEDHSELLYNIYTYMLRVMAGQSHIADPVYLKAEYLGNSYFIYNGRDEVLAFGELSGDLLDEPLVLSIVANTNILNIRDQAEIDALIAEHLGEDYG